MKTLLAAAVCAAGLALGASTAQAGFSDVVEAPTGFFVPTDAQKYDSPYYRGFGQDWSWQHGAIAGAFTTADLFVSAFDVDSCCGEVDEISAWNSSTSTWMLLGSLTGTNDEWDYGNDFSIPNTLFDDVATGLKVMIHIDANDQGWVVTLGKSVLSIDGGGVPPPTPGAPEPATWAMMALGFVGLGAIAYRKRTALKAA